MELTELEKLIALLRANGVTQYRDERITLVLDGKPEQPAPTAQVAQSGARQGLTDELARALRRLDPQYADASLFSFE